MRLHHLAGELYLQLVWANEHAVRVPIKGELPAMRGYGKLVATKYYSNETTIIDESLQQKPMEQLMFMNLVIIK